jgi:hypothetical protein
VPSAFGVRSTITAQPGLHSLYSIGSSGTTTFAGGLTAAFATVRFTARFTGRVRRPVPRVARVRVARMFPLSPASSAIASRDLRSLLRLPWALSFRITPRLSSYQLSVPSNCFQALELKTETSRFTTTRLLLSFSDVRLKTYNRKLKTSYLRRCSIMRSVRLLCRVFFPNVGKAQGVCGWLPFTLPSPPPCG